MSEGGNREGEAPVWEGEAPAWEGEAPAEPSSRHAVAGSRLIRSLPRAVGTRSVPATSGHLLFIPLMCAAFLVGCTNAVQSGHNTLLDSVDLRQMTDQMARSIAADPRVQQAIRQDGALKIVVQPVENQLTAEVLPRGQAEAFTARVRSLLSQRNPTEFVWVLNRDDFYDLRKKENLDVPLGPSPEAINPQFALTAVFTSLTNETSRGRSDFYVCSYQLADLQTRNVLWSDSYKVKKSAVKGFLD